MGGCLVTSGGYAADLQNPTWQIYNSASQGLSYTSPFPTSILTDQVPYSLYPLMFVLPGTGSVLVRSWALGLPELNESILNAVVVVLHSLDFMKGFGQECGQQICQQCVLVWASLCQVMSGIHLFTVAFLRDPL